MDDSSNIARTTPDEWAARLSGPADLSSDPGTWSTALVRHWTDTSPQMDQPPLDHHYIVQHLGGAKRVERRHDGAPVSAIVEYGAITVVPAGTQFNWHTFGPIEFAHLYISPTMLANTALRFDRVHELSLIERVGCRDPLLESLYRAMLVEIRQPHPPHVLYLDSLLETFLLKLLIGHTSAHLRSPKPRETLPAFRLKRVIDFVEAHLGSPLNLADLTLIAGGSVFHFSRAFKNTTGYAPCQYVLQRRLMRAKLLLTTTDWPLTNVANACGFHDTIHFSRTFSRMVGATPARYRRERARPGGGLLQS
jgi:AraC family transcriptional regulator